MTETCPTCGNLLKHNCATDDRRLPIDRPCSACGDGDYNMEHHLHCPPFRHDAKEEKAPAQATREQLEAALKASIHALKETYRILSYFVSHSDDCNFGANNPEGDYCTCRVQRHTRNTKALVDSVTAEAERLLGGK